MKSSQFVIIGLGRFGSSIAKELIALGHEVLGIDSSEERVDEMSPILTHSAIAMQRMRKCSVLSVSEILTVVLFQLEMIFSPAF